MGRFIKSVVVAVLLSLAATWAWSAYSGRPLPILASLDPRPATISEAKAAAMKGVTAARKLRPSLPSEVPVFELLPASDPTLRGKWDGKHVTVYWHGKKSDLGLLDDTAAHEYGHRAVQTTLEKALGEVKAARVLGLLGQPNGKGLDEAVHLCPALAPVAEAYRSNSRVYGDYGAQNPDEWLAEGFRLAALGPKEATGWVPPDPSMMDFLGE